MYTCIPYLIYMHVVCMFDIHACCMHVCLWTHCMIQHTHTHPSSTQHACYSNMHVTFYACSMHVTCMENVPNSCMLHETCMYINMVTCMLCCSCKLMIIAWNMHVTCTLFWVGWDQRIECSFAPNQAIKQCIKDNQTA